MKNNKYLSVRLLEVTNIEKSEEVFDKKCACIINAAKKLGIAFCNESVKYSFGKLALIVDFYFRSEEGRKVLNEVRKTYGGKEDFDNNVFDTTEDAQVPVEFRIRK